MLTLRLLPGRYAVAQVDALPPWFALDAPLAAAVRRGSELSLVAPEEAVPGDVKAERGFRALEVTGPLAFELTGIMASVAQPLADAGVWIFTLATYDTDVVLVPDARLDVALAALRAAGHTVD